MLSPKSFGFLVFSYLCTLFLISASFVFFADSSALTLLEYSFASHLILDCHSEPLKAF
jgi:hypothetical protein